MSDFTYNPNLSPSGLVLLVVEINQSNTKKTKSQIVESLYSAGIAKMVRMGESARGRGVAGWMDDIDFVLGESDGWIVRLGWRMEHGATELLAFQSLPRHHPSYDSTSTEFDNVTKEAIVIVTW